MASAPIYVIDTHPLIWYFEDSPRLSTPARRAFVEIEQGISLGVVQTIVLAEIMHLTDRKKIPLSIGDTIARVQTSNFGIVSLDLMALLLMIPLKTLELHDRVIVATAKSFGAALITKDEHIRESGTIVCVW